MYIVRCILWGAYCEMYILRCTSWSVYSEMYILKCILGVVCYEMYSLWCISWDIYCKKYNVSCILWVVYCEMYTVIMVATLYCNCATPPTKAFIIVWIYFWMFAIVVGFYWPLPDSIYWFIGISPQCTGKCPEQTSSWLQISSFLIYKKVAIKP